MAGLACYPARGRAVDAGWVKTVNPQPSRRRQEFMGSRRRLAFSFRASITRHSKSNPFQGRMGFSTSFGGLLGLRPRVSIPQWFDCDPAH